MSEISIIINGVRYDAVEISEAIYANSVCAKCDICNIIPNFPCSYLIGADRAFKKSDKKFEKSSDMISIIIDGVRYDAVKQLVQSCNNCELHPLCKAKHFTDLCLYQDKLFVFKKSDKKFEI